MATLLQHADKIREEFNSAFSDKKLTFAEVFHVAGVIVGAAACTIEKIDNEQVGELADEAEALYDSLLDASKIDIPRVPEFAERYVIDLGKAFIRPAIQKLVDAVN